MKQNNVLIAPQIGDLQTAFHMWKNMHNGSYQDFYQFMTTPSAERAAFMANPSVSVHLRGSYIYTII